MKNVVIVEQGLNTKEPSGIQRNTKEILYCLDKIVEPGKVDLLVPAYEDTDYSFDNIKVQKVGICLNGLGKIGERIAKYAYKNFYSRSYIKKNDAISMDFLLQFPIFGCDIITIYDCIPEMFPEIYNTRKKRRNRKKLLRHQRMAIKKSKLILTDSQDAKEDIMKFYGVDDRKIEVIPCGWQHFNRVKEDERIIDNLKLTKGEYFFSLGNRLRHKNIKWVSYAAKKNPKYKFVISGSENSNTSFEFEGDKLPNMIFAGYLSDAEVKALMRHCKAFLQPSLYEGFGIPPMEAMSVGADCIVSDRASLPEVYKKSVWYINPEDYENIDLDEIMSRQKESNEFILNEYSWEKSARKLKEILERM